MSFDQKNEFYNKLNDYYLEKPGQKPHSIVEINTIIKDIVQAKLNK